MKETVFFGAATGLPILPPALTIVVTAPTRHAARVAAQSDRRQRGGGSAAPPCTSGRTAGSSPRSKSGDGR
ncbi:MAG TPA: hypothetical protein VMR06_00025 [Dokdonella sp.]|nr:hypothetical protein [Dokdonella sp.]